MGNGESGMGKMMGSMMDLMGKVMSGGRADARDQQEQNRLAADMTRKHEAQMKKMQDEQKEQAEAAERKQKEIMEKFKDDRDMMVKKLEEAQKRAVQEKQEMLEMMESRAKKFTKTYAKNMDKLKQKQAKINAAYPPPPFYANLMKKLKAKYGAKYTKIPIVALCGGTGEGKSSWLNELLMQSGSDQRAKVGAGGECTVEMDDYEWCEDGINPVVFIDCPGGGTINFPAESYVRTIGLRYYDAALFFCDQRFKEPDTMIINDCNRYKINYFAVKTKVAASVANVKRDFESMGKPIPSRKEILEILRKTLYSMPDVKTKQIMLTGVPMDNIYLSDCRDWDEYETGELLEKLAAVCQLGRSVNVQFNQDTGKWENGDANERAQMAKIQEEMAELRMQTGGGSDMDHKSAMDG